MFFILFFLLPFSMSEATQSSLCEDVFLEEDTKGIISLMPYEEAKAFVQELGFENRAEFFRFVQSTELPDGFPKDPHIVYKEQWEGWPKFLGIEEEILNKKSTDKVSGEKFKEEIYAEDSLGETADLDFTEEAHNKDFLEEEESESINKVLGSASSEKRPVPKKKSQTKRRSRSAYHLARNSTARRNNLFQQRKWMPYEKAKAFIQEKAFQNRKEFQKWSKSKARPSDFPSAPSRIYEEKWEGWRVFLGTQNKVRRRREWKTYEEAKAFIQTQNIGSAFQFREWGKSGARPSDFPSNPSRMYQEEWEGWKEFLGTENKPNPKRDWRSYEEAKTFVQTQGIRSASQFQEWSKSKARPSDFPSRPDKVYEEEWEGWKEFLGTQNKHHRKFWMPYGKAQALMREEGIQTLSQFEKWKQNGKRPPDFPSHPEKVYEEEWEGWREFLGTSWMTYEEAQAYIQAKDILKVYQFEIWSVSSARPPNFPSNPDRVYKDQWEGWPVFLGTAN